MSNGDDVLDNWEEIDESGLSKTLESQLRTTDDAIESKEEKQIVGKMKLLQRPQSQPTGQENSLVESPSGSSSANQSSPKQLIIAKKPLPLTTTTTTTTSAAAAAATDDETSTPVLMVLHKSSSEYDAATYATPINNQTVKILRRPAQAEERRDTNGLKPKQPIKTLKQRELEYAEARLRILGEAKNPEDDEENSSNQVDGTANAAVTAASTTPTPTSAAVAAATTTNPSQLTLSPAASNSNHHHNNSSSGSNNNNNPHPGMHRSSSAPKMSQTSAYGNYNSYFAGALPPPQHNAGLNYFYQHAGATQQAPPNLQQHFNQFMTPYGPSGAAAGAGAIGVAGLGGGAGGNSQQTWSPVVGGSVSAALLRQQSMQTPHHHHQQQQQQQQQQQHQQQQHQQQQQQQQQPHHPYNDNILRLPRGPNGSFGFQMRR